MDATERALLRESVESALGQARGSGATAGGVDAALGGLGWREMLETEPDDAVAIVFTALGRADATSTALDDVLALALGVPARDDLAVLLPAFGAWTPPGASGIGTARTSTARDLLVVDGDAGQPRIATVPVSATRATPVRGIDPEAGLHLLDVDRDALATAEPLDPSRWDAAVALGRRAIGHQIAGACRAMLDLACTHAVERVQFGRPVARFQAVRHRLADALVAVEALEATLAAAADAPGPETAALAKAMASRSARTVATHCQQVLAGIGFTTDHSFHRSLKRTMVLDGLFGSADEIVVAVGRELLAARRVPTLIDL